MVYDAINLMCPTFKRPDKLRRFINSALITASNTDKLRFTFCVHENDQESVNVIEQQYFPRKRQVCIVRERTQQPNLPLYFNLMYTKTAFDEPGTLATMLGDDMVFQTKGWEGAILDVINNRNGNAMVFCNDAFIAQEKLCVNLFVPRKIVDATEMPFMCPKFHADMIDVVWHEVGIRTQLLLYLADVVIQHDHEMKREQKDETFIRMQPLRRAANTKENQVYAKQYATVAAFNIIQSGIGDWGRLG